MQPRPHILLHNMIHVECSCCVFQYGAPVCILHVSVLMTKFCVCVQAACGLLHVYICKIQSIQGPSVHTYWCMCTDQTTVAVDRAPPDNWMYTVPQLCISALVCVGMCVCTDQCVDSHVNVCESYTSDVSHLYRYTYAGICSGPCVCECVQAVLRGAY